MGWLDIWHQITGWVRFEGEGGLPGRLLTLSAREDLPLWDTKRDGTLFSACCAAKQYRRLRPLARRSGLKLRITERHGLAFRLQKYHARAGIPAGALVFALLLMFLSGRIWALDIQGIERADEAALRSLLAEHGVAVGCRRKDVNLEKVQLAAMTELADISWLSVSLDGCIAEVQVREMNPDEAPAEATAPSNLIAAQDGVVLSVTITEGEATVQVGDAVAKGGMLASGITPTAGETLVRRSAGVVMAKTTRELTVSVPLTEELMLPSDGGFETLELHVFSLRLPLYYSGIPVEGHRVEVCDRQWTVGGVTLPLGIQMRRYTPLLPTVVTRTETEAKALAEERLCAEERAVLADAEIQNREVFCEVADGTLLLRGVYECVENIALEVPIQLESLT